ncbi:Membrane protein [Mycena venus]|uniref:Membrane protein n=1 Tax=Mycena venus TaxID=2733690 RepID=A0A8H6Y1B0_9AGAR|nr:Membrane protein [Mycena venus]
MSRLFGRLPASMSLALLSFLLLRPVLADPASIPFQDCFSGNASMKLTVDEVYAQVLTSSQLGTYLNLTVIGNSPQEIFGFTDSSSSLGPFALSSAIPWGTKRALTTLNTRLRAVDPSSQELLCVNVNTTPLDPRDPHAPYGAASVIFWATVTLAILYWVVIGVARVVSAWGRGITRPGRSFVGSRAKRRLYRSDTPCLRDVLFHTQWCAALAMVAVQWPPFAYPLLAQTAWATLSYNITLANSNVHWNPLTTLPFNPPSGFSDQLADKTSPLFIDPTVPNLLFTLPPNATSGMSMFAYTIGVRPEDLFGLCIVLFLAIVAATIVISSLVWFIDLVGSLITGAVTSHPARRARSPGPKELETAANTDESKPAIFRPSSRPTLTSGMMGGGGSALRKPWYRMRTEISSFHGSVLHGNLVRILVLFHLPLTIFAAYEMTRPTDDASVRARALAALSFAVLSVLLPVALVVRVTLTTTNKLYDETRTLLALGPLYNHYRHGSQLFASLHFATNLVFGVVIGVGQKSGTAQAIVILVVEVAAALVTSIWLPWGSGASMGLISFLFCVARIVIAVLLVILSPAISIGDGSGAWVAYGILVILALVYLALVLMLLIKIIEAAVRIVGRVGFDRSSHSVDSGLLGACGLLGCCGSRKRRSPRHRNRTHNARARGYAQANPVRASDSSSTYVPPPPLGSADNASSRKGSFHSQQPPSVLRPEHALRPYREDSDDESGYIMGAWQPFPRPGYVPVKDTPPPAAPAPSSGFSRVGGGRAHIDTPYAAITPQGGSTPTLEWPAMDAARAEDEAPPMSTVVRRQSPETVSPPSGSPGPGGVPRGAMLPHMRTKSQTAIIEDAPILLGSSRPPSRAKVLQQQQQQQQDDDDDDGESAEAGQQRRKKPWYHIRRHRPHSEGTPPPPPSSYSGQAEQAAAATANVPTGRSFVVIRKPQASPARSQQLSTASSPTPTRGSFRAGNDSGDARASSATS